MQTSVEAPVYSHTIDVIVIGIDWVFFFESNIDWVLISRKKCTSNVYDFA